MNIPYETEEQVRYGRIDETTSLCDQGSDEVDRSLFLVHWEAESTIWESERSPILLIKMTLVVTDWVEAIFNLLLVPETLQYVRIFAHMYLLSVIHQLLHTTSDVLAHWRE